MGVLNASRTTNFASVLPPGEYARRFLLHTSDVAFCQITCFSVLQTQCRVDVLCTCFERLKSNGPQIIGHLAAVLWTCVQENEAKKGRALKKIEDERELTELKDREIERYIY